MNMVESIERPAGKAAASFGLERLTGAIGAEVSGLDLTQDLPDTVILQLSDALVRHKVLFFRDQPISRSAANSIWRSAGASGRSRSIRSRWCRCSATMRPTPS
jgi:hypothetical protein